MKRRNICFLACLMAANLALIWGNSLLSGEMSGNISGGLLHWLTDLLNRQPVTELVLRKLGHFSEFACLGLLLSLFWRLLNQQGFHRFTLPLLCGLIAACVDETIQVFVPERGPSVLDVWIDVAGVVTGMIACQIGYHIVRKFKKSSFGG